MKSALLLTGLILVVSFSLLTYSRLGAFYFAKGSNSTLVLARPSPWILAVFAIGFSLFITFLIWRSTLGVKEFIILLFLLSCWLISGRVVGVFPDGRIVAGWFFIRTSVVDFRGRDEDHELYISHTAVLDSQRWEVEIRSHDQRATIFVGPVLKNKLLELLKERGFDIGREVREFGDGI